MTQSQVMEPASAAKPRLALTPPMGWNSWNCWAKHVDDAKIRAAAEHMAASGLRDCGWQYINIDDGWQGTRDPNTGALQPNDKFPDMPGLCDHVHALGLKIGIYSTPWKVSYAGFPGGSADHADGTNDPALSGKFGAHCFAEQDARQWAAWGIDYLKYDWNPIDVAHTRVMADALRNCGRDIVYTLSNSADIALAPQLAQFAHAWRTTGDIIDLWHTPPKPEVWEHSVTEIGFSQDAWAPLAGPGRWNDADMLVVGQLGWGTSMRASRLTQDEQRTHVSLWCLLASPLLLGCDLSQLDAFTLGLLTNKEVIAVNQDALGRQGRRVFETGDCQVWSKPLADGSLAVGLFNLSGSECLVTAEWSRLGIVGEHVVRDLWSQQDVGHRGNRYECTVPPHGVAILRLTRV